jgi:hypothetical protein
MASLSSPVRRALGYWDNWYVTKEVKCSEYSPRSGIVFSSQISVWNT